MIRISFQATLKPNSQSANLKGLFNTESGAKSILIELADMCNATYEKSRNIK